MRRRVHLARAATRGDDAGWWATGRLGDVLVGLRTGVAVRLGGEARQGCGRTVALGPWGCGLACRRARGSGVAWPRPMEHDAQPHQGDQHQLGEKERGYHELVASFVNRSNLLKSWEKTEICAV